MKRTPLTRRKPLRERPLVGFANLTLPQDHAATQTAAPRVIARKKPLRRIVFQNKAVVQISSAASAGWDHLVGSGRDLWITDVEPDRKTYEKLLRYKQAKEKRKRERRKKAFAKQFHSAAFVAWIHEQPCVVEDCFSDDIQIAHVRSRGAGGTYKDVVPMCVVHHGDQHAHGIRTFQAVHKINLMARAAKTWAAFAREKP